MDVYEVFGVKTVTLGVERVKEVCASSCRYCTVASLSILLLTLINCVVTCKLVSCSVLVCIRKYIGLQCGNLTVVGAEKTNTIQNTVFAQLSARS